MLTMDEYQVVDQILPNYLEVGDLIKVKNDVYEVINLNPTPEGWDIIVLDNYEETKTISVPDGKKVNLVLSDEFEG
jgi:signal peptidase I